MSLVSWIVLFVIAYFANSAYQRIQHSRKRTEFVRDRRRAAGIPDDDHRPFAVARADALSRRSQQRREGSLSTPTKKQTSARPRTTSRAMLDREAASRLAGIPGTLPGYLKDTLGPETKSSPSNHRQERNHSRRLSKDLHRASPGTANSTSFDSSPSNATMKRRSSQAPGDSPPRRARRIGAQDKSGTGGSREPKRQHEESPTKTDAMSEGQSRAKKQRAAIPGTFGSDQPTSDHDMSDATASQVEEDDEEEFEGLKEEPMEEEAASFPGRTVTKRPTAETRRGSVSASARATAKKREADELDDSEDEASTDSGDDEEHAASHVHSSKRSRKANKEVDPSSALDFDMALPEEAMTDFNPAASSATGAGPTLPRTKRSVDTSDDREPGEEWVDFEGLRWRIHPDTHELERWSDVLEWRSKYQMPRDSLHPMAREEHQVVVHKWLTKQEWETAKENKLLAFQEAERLAAKEEQDRIEAEKMQRKQELLAKIRQTASPNKRIQSYLMQQHKKTLQHRLSQSELSADVSMTSNTTLEPDDGAASMSIDSVSMLDGATPSKPRSRRISLRSLTPARSGDQVVRTGSEQRGPANSSTTASPVRRNNSPLATPYRAIQYPKQRKQTSSSLVNSFSQPASPK